MAASCVDYQIIFARGSGEELNGPSFRSFKSGLTEAFSTGLKSGFSFYELGSKSQGGHQYPATDVGKFSVLLGAKVSGGTAFAYGKSVEQGREELKSYVQKVTSACPTTKFILAGYSQGAQVISTTISALNPDKIAYIATFGDPKLYLPEGAKFSIDPPSACVSTKNLSAYRIHVPDCTVYEGVLGGTIPYQPAKYENKLGTWCNLHDFMCGSSFDFGDLLGAHTAYPTDDSYAHAGRVILKAIRKQSATTATETTTTARDVAILIDSTGSMSGHIERYKEHALRLAKSIILGGGRVALYEYRDIDDPFLARKLCDFDCPLSDFTEKLSAITTGGGGDNPESALSASLDMLNNLSWGKGAIKSLLILTDAATHSPDRDGVTKEQVVKRAWEIDPVHISVITDTSNDIITGSFAEVVSQTGGKFYSLTDEDMELSTTDTLTITEDLTLPYLYNEMEIPTLALSSAKKDGTTLSLTLDKSANTAYTMLTVGESVLGLTPENTLTLTDLTEATTITLTPISTTGHRGEKISLHFDPYQLTPKAPNTGGHPKN